MGLVSAETIEFGKNLLDGLVGPDLVVGAGVDGDALEMGGYFLHDLLAVMGQHYFIFLAAEDQDGDIEVYLIVEVYFERVVVLPYFLGQHLTKRLLHVAESDVQ